LLNWGQVRISWRKFGPDPRVLFRNIMEAEYINLIAKRLDDVAARAAELRRYL